MNSSVQSSGLADQAHRFLGLSLSGGKADKACLVVLEYYPNFKKIFLSKVFDRIKTEGEISADLKIHEIIESYQGKVELLAIDVPWMRPFCNRCDLPCPGYENCQVEHVVWMRERNKAEQKSKKPKKMFTPYTERPVEMHLRLGLEEPMIFGPTLGSNLAPLLARAAFIQRRLHVPCIEVFPKLSVWRMGRALGVGKTHLRAYRHSAHGNESRRVFLNQLNQLDVAFMYNEDFRLMIDNNHAFEAFIGALTAYLSFTKQTEAPPADFPRMKPGLNTPNRK